MIIQNKLFLNVSIAKLRWLTFSHSMFIHHILQYQLSCTYLRFTTWFDIKCKNSNRFSSTLQNKNVRIVWCASEIFINQGQNIESKQNINQCQPRVFTSSSTRWGKKAILWNQHCLGGINFSGFCGLPLPTIYHVTSKV